MSCARFSDNSSICFLAVRTSTPEGAATGRARAQLRGLNDVSETRLPG